MAISLQKGQKIDLRKNDGGGLSRVRLGLAWDAAQSKGIFGGMFSGKPKEIDLDASCLLFNSGRQPVDAVWFGQLKSKDGSIVHSGDNRTGDGDGDDETIMVDLTRLPAEVTDLVFTVNSFQGQNFNEVENATCRILDEANGQELATFTLSDKGGHTGTVMAVLSRGPSGWTFKAVGTTLSGRTVQDMVPASAQAI